MIGFALVAAVVICTPGPDTALTIRNTLLGGRGNGLRTAQGVAVGQALWTLAASAGVAALVAASQPVFVAVRIAGAAYLVWLGLHALAAACRDVAVSQAGIPFDSVDGEPVHVLVLLISPQDRPTV